MRKLQNRSRSFTPKLQPIVNRITTTLQPVSQARPSIDQGINEYEVIRQLGKGSFATVYLAKHRTEGFRVAIKSYNKATPQLLKTVQNEISVLQFLDHPNIVKLIEARQEPSAIHLILEYVAGSSLENFTKSRPVDETECNKIFRQILSAIQYCHTMGVVHRDLKPSNILIDSGKKVKIIDFGFASMNGDYQLKLYCGTPEFMAPELIMQRPYNGQKVDMWALGIILHFMLTKRYPFIGKNERDILRKVKMAGLQNLGKLPKEVAGLVGAMLAVEPSFRITANEAAKSPWLGIARYKSY